MTATDAPPAEPDWLIAERAEADAHAPRHGQPARRTPPHNLDAEEALLGACLLAPTAIDDALDAGLEAHHFYAPRHQHVYDAVTTLYAEGKAHDPIAVAAHLATVGHPDITAAVLVELETHTTSTAAATYAAHIIDRHRARRLIGVGSEVAQLGWDNPRDIGQAEETARTLIAQVVERRTGNVDFEDVAAAMRGEVAPVVPTILHRTDGQALIYPGLLHWLMGDPGKGKTWVQVMACAEVILNGGKALLLDWEGNRRIIGDRFAAIGLSPQQVQDGLYYWRPPRLDRTMVAALAELVADQAVDICCYDGVAKALARNDYNEDAASDVLAWLELAVHPITEAGAAALVLDHLKKDKDSAGLWPRGSGAKQGEVSGAAWKVTPRVAFSRQKAGHFDLIQAKDREGYVGEDGSTVAQCYATPSGGLLQLDLRPPIGGEFEPTMYMERVSRFIEDQPLSGGVLSQNDIEQGVTGKATHIRAAIAALVKHGHIDRVKVGTERDHRIVKTYREDAPTRPTDDPTNEKF